MNRSQTSHILHFVLSVLTAGAWIPIWIIVAFRSELWSLLISLFSVLISLSPYGRFKKKLISQLTPNRFENIDDIISQIEMSPFKKKEKSLHSYIFKSMLRHYLDDNLLTDGEENTLLNFSEKYSVEIKKSDLDLLSHAKFLRKMSEGIIDDNILRVEGAIPFIPQKNEKILWIFSQISLSENIIEYTMEGSSSGISVPIGNNFYYNLNSFKGKQVPHNKSVHYGSGFFKEGILCLTNQHILYFGSQSLKVNYDDIASIQFFSNGFIFNFNQRTFNVHCSAEDSFFISNMISMLNKIER